MNTERIFIKNLNPGNVFVMPGSDTLLVCESRRTMENMTSVTYHLRGYGAAGRFAFARVNLSTIDLVTAF